MRTRGPTSLDVAHLAGVSQSAVSRAFTPGASVSKKMREKVLAAAQELGYEPNAIARSLITHRSNMVGIVMADMTNPFYPEVLETFTKRLQELERRVLLFTVSRGQDIDDALPQVLQYQVDGIVITSATLSSEMADECARRGTPVVLFNRYVRGADLCSVCCDNAESGRLLANLLLDAGLRRLSFIAGTENTSTNVDRERGFVGRLEERGFSLFARETGNYTYDGGYQAAKRLMAGDEPPDAVFCANDIMALGALDAVRRELGLRVPEDVSIVGFDDIPAAAWPSYDLTTVRQPINRMIEETVELLLARVEEPGSEPTTRLVPGDLIVRGSVRLPGEMTRGRISSANPSTK